MSAETLAAPDWNGYVPAEVQAEQHYERAIENARFYMIRAEEFDVNDDQITADFLRSQARFELDWYGLKVEGINA
jgi:hypothetical protein